MKYNIINKELKIATCSIADLTLNQTERFLRQWEKGATIGGLTLFFEYEGKYDGYVILNRDHEDFGSLLILAEEYLKGNEGERAEVYEHAPDSLKSSMQILEKAVYHREIESEIRIALKNCIPDQNARDVVNEITRTNNELASAYIAFRYGVICGKREERRKKARHADKA